MNSTMTQDTYEPMSVSSERTFPEAPFPRKYVHSVFENLQDARQAAHVLSTTGFDARDIHIMTGWDYVEAVERRQTFLSLLSSIDYDGYLLEARRGHYILAVRPSGQEQMERVSGLLAPHHARLVKYIDTWTVAELLP
jgi:N-formylglutamate amidohydrolase